MKRLLTIISVVLALASCTSKHPLVIIHLNDTHSHFDPSRSGDMNGRGGAIERAAIIDSIRNAEGEENVLLVHAGDWNQGSSYFTEFKGKLEVQTVNQLRYDVVTLGNHEFDNGIEDLAERVKFLDCPVVCANLDLNGFELANYVKPWAVIEKGGRRVGFIGLTCVLKGNIRKDIDARLNQFDPVETVNLYSTALRRDMACDKVVVLSHQGFDADTLNVKGFHDVDLVIGGHTHTFMDELLWLKDADGKDVAVISDGCFGWEIGKIEMK